MPDDKLGQQLRQTFILVNETARVVSQKVLERCIDVGLEQAGADWLVETAGRFGLANGDCIHSEIGTFLENLKSEQGHAELRRYASANEGMLKQWRRKLVQLTHMSGFGEHGTEFTFDKLPDNGGIYRILVNSQNKSGEGDTNEKRDDDHPRQ